jgi:serine/threonine protein kinase
MSLTRLLAALPEPLFSTYQLESVLGVGAYAVVYQIRDKQTLEAFALKVIEIEPMRIRDMLPQLEREVSIMEEHAFTPHVVQLLEVTKTKMHILLRFELCMENLEDVCLQKGSMSEQEGFKWLREACLGVQELHQTGVIHRDLKPSNLLVDSQGQLRICDFGWACTEQQRLTGTCGTPEYASPETSGQNGGALHTAKVDTYGLGACLQHFLLGRPPTGPGDLPKGLSVETRELLLEMMDQDPEVRPTVEDLLARPQLEEKSVLGQLWSNWRLIFDVPIKQKKPQAEVNCGIAGFVF